MLRFFIKVSLTLIVGLGFTAAMFFGGFIGMDALLSRGMDRLTIFLIAMASLAVAASYLMACISFIWREPD